MYIGIDVAKDELVVCLLQEQTPSDETTVPNTKSGINKLHRWLKKAGAKTGHVCLEATGVYSDMVAEELYKRGYTVSVVNPARIKAYAQSQMRRNKTDQLDAALIADYCRTQAPPAWTPPAPELKHLRLLIRHLDDLKTERQRARNRRDAQPDAVIVKQLKAQIDLLDKQVTQTEQLIRDHVDKHPDLKKQRDLLATIPGIGLLTASLLLAELGDMQRFDNVRQVVAFVGLNPRLHQSGKKRVQGGISRMGRASLRAALYMPALSARRNNPVLRAFADRLEANGLKGKQVIVAVMRKLIHLAYGILKSGQPFEANYGQSVAIAA